jgi:hypothetical protein
MKYKHRVANEERRKIKSFINAVHFHNDVNEILTDTVQKKIC